MDRFSIERFVASSPHPPLAIPRYRGRHDLGPGLRRWVDNRTRQAGLILVQLVEAGEMRVRWRQTTYTAIAPCLVLTAFAEDSQYGTPDRLGPGYRSFWLNLDGPGLTMCADRLREASGPVWPDPHGVIARRLRPLQAASALTLPDPALTRLAGDLLALLYELRAAPPHDGVATTALAAVAADPFRPWNLTSLARTHGCSRAQLFRAARRRWGVGIKRWIDLQRLQRADMLLRQGGRRSAEVAAAVGYASVQVLNRHLRAQRTRVR